MADCESLNAGRSAEAMLATMMGKQTGTKAIEKVMYGDNVAAIGLAQGTSGSTWRTRHLKIRASYLREALDGKAADGVWRLLHLKHTELVADGLTRPLLGQAFRAFLSELRMERQAPQAQQDQPSGFDQKGAAVAAVMAGGLLLSGVDAAAAENGEATSDAIWACGAILVALGTIYVGQLTYSGLKCCLRRLRATTSSSEVDSPWILCDASGSEGEDSSSMPSRWGSHSKTCLGRWMGTTCPKRSRLCSDHSRTGALLELTVQASFSQLQLASACRF